MFLLFFFFSYLSLYLSKFCLFHDNSNILEKAELADRLTHGLTVERQLDSGQVLRTGESIDGESLFEIREDFTSQPSSQTTSVKSETTSVLTPMPQRPSADSSSELNARFLSFWQRLKTIDSTKSAHSERWNFLEEFQSQRYPAIVGSPSHEGATRTDLHSPTPSPMSIEPTTTTVANSASSKTRPVSLFKARKAAALP